MGRFEEALQIIHPLLRTGAVDFKGKYYEARECELLRRGHGRGTADHDRREARQAARAPAHRAIC